MSPGSTGVSFISAFSFTGAAGQWERVFDFGNGPDSGNFLLAREGTSNNLKLFTNIGRGAAMAELTLAGFIQQNQIVVSVATYVSMPFFSICSALDFHHALSGTPCWAPTVSRVGGSTAVWLAN
jgi:hypothetical protein